MKEKLKTNGGKIAERIAKEKAFAQANVELQKFEAEIGRDKDALRAEVLKKTAMVEKLKAIAQENAKKQTDEIAKIKAELGMKMLRIKVEANNLIANEVIKTKELELKADREELDISKPAIKAKQKTVESAANIKKFAKKVASYTKTEKLLENSPTTSSTP